MAIFAHSCDERRLDLFLGLLQRQEIFDLLLELPKCCIEYKHVIEVQKEIVKTCRKVCQWKLFGTVNFGCTATVNNVQKDVLYYISST